MKLSIKQQSVLGAVQFHSNATIKEIAKKTTLRENTVRRSLEFLINNAIVRPFVLIDFHKLGILDFAIFVKRGAGTAEEQKKLINFVQKTINVTWFAEMSGTFQYALSFMGRDIGELDQLLTRLAEEVGPVIKQSYIAPRIRFEIYQQKRLLSEKSRSERLVCEPGEIKLDLSKIQIKVLSHLCQNPSMSISAMSKILKMPASTFKYHLDALAQKKVILAFAYYIDYTKLGSRKYALLIYEVKASKTKRKQFLEFCLQNIYITCCLQALAEWTFEIDVEVMSGEQLSVLKQEIFEKFSDYVDHIETLEYLKTHKMSPNPCL